MYLCHKCAGILANYDEETVTGLLSCSCISGYIRGNEPNQTRLEAINAQIKQQESRVRLFKRQDRTVSELAEVQEKLNGLLTLKGGE